MKATIFEIKRFAVHDGDGIRTTVFFKGCPLRCVWCHNPEGLSAKPQIAYYEHKCIGCGECKKEGFMPEDCLGEAQVLYGKKVTVEELLPALLEDRDFYENSGGGVTLSGGECLMQADFCAELLKRLKENGIHTAVDTCGFVSKEALDKVVPYTDIFLYDFKAYDEDVHIKCTGKSNKIIIENLLYLESLGKDVEIRIPYVPEYNSDQIEKIAHFLSDFTHVTKIRVLPYHNYAGSKYAALNMEDTLPRRLPTDEELASARNCIKEITKIIVSA
jgi:pyruvate formate lyase activating enzyme